MAASGAERAGGSVQRAHLRAWGAGIEERAVPDLGSAQGGERDEETAIFRGGVTNRQIDWGGGLIRRAHEPSVCYVMI
jgi:hypothetical protein